MVCNKLYPQDSVFCPSDAPMAINEGGDTYADPSYAWFNGVVEYANDEKTIAPEGIAPVISIQGNPSSGKSRIWPFKIMMVIQTLAALLFQVIWALASF